MSQAAQEIIVDWTPTSTVPCHLVRSTLLSSSVQTLRSRGHFDRYVELLPEEHHEAVLHTIAATWLPIEHGLAHYRACDALMLPLSEQRAIGNGVGDEIRGTFLGSLAKGARNIGANPWVPLARFTRLWERLFQGGGVQVIKTGPKDAQINVRNSPIHEIDYFRCAFLGVVQTATEVFARRAYASEVSGSHTGNAVTYSLSWV